MKKHVISVSSHDLTRCSHCSRHQQIDRSLSSEELLALKCHFCHAPLIASNQASTSRLGRTSKLAIGLLSASLSFTACENSTEEEQVQAGEMAGVDIVEAGDLVGAPEYGAPPVAGEEGGEMAGVDIEPAGEPIFEAMYGAPPPAGMEAGEMAGVEMVPAGEDMSQPEYGAPPPAGEEAGEEAGTTAGETAGETAGVEMVPAGEDMPQPEYGAPPPAGEEG